MRYATTPCRISLSVQVLALPNYKGQQSRKMLNTKLLGLGGIMLNQTHR